MAVNGVEIAAGQVWSHHGSKTLNQVFRIDSPDRILVARGDGVRYFVTDRALLTHWSLKRNADGTEPTTHVPPEMPVEMLDDPVTADGLLGQAAKHMRDRAATYDKPQGERSMAATVQAFNAQTGRNLTESEGWLFMVNLKIVRDRQRPDAHRDSCEDLVAYGALYSEARLK